MPPPLLFDIHQVDTDRIAMTRDQIYELLPQRYEFEVLSGVCLIDRENRRVVAFADITTDDWWVRGHLPIKTLLPGALMLEMAGQAAAIGASEHIEKGSFMGFGGVDQCKFRDAVIPPARIYILVQGDELRPRRIISSTQGLQDGRLVFEARITGVVVR